MAKSAALTDLAGEAEHVWIQPVLEQDRFLNLVGGTMRGSFVDNASECAKLLGAGGYGRVDKEYAIWISPSKGTLWARS